MFTYNTLENFEISCLNVVRKCICKVTFLLNVYRFLSISPPPPTSFWCKHRVEDRIQLPHCIEGMHFLDHTFYIFVDEVVLKIFVYLLIINPSSYENVANLFKLDMERRNIVIFFKLIKQPFKNFLVFNGRH